MLKVFATTRRGAEFHVPFHDLGVVGFLRFVIVQPLSSPSANRPRWFEWDGSETSPVVAFGRQPVDVQGIDCDWFQPIPRS